MGFAENMRGGATGLGGAFDLGRQILAELRAIRAALEARAPQQAPGVCACAVPQDIEGSCMRCGAIVPGGPHDA